MSDLPFGFTPPGGGAGSGGSGSGGSGSGGSGSGPGGPGGPDDPFGFLSGMFGGQFPGGAGFFGELQRMLAWTGGPINWDLAGDLARRTAAEGDPPVSSADASAVDEALRLADLWLEPHTTLPAGAGGSEAWTRTRWVEATLPVWRQLCDPVASRVVAAMSSSLGGALPADLPEEVRAMAGMLPQVMTQVGGALFGAQVGQAIGTLAREVVSASDIGLPLGPPGRAVLVPAGVAAVAEGLDVPDEEVRVYLALREAAHDRLFAHVPWLRAHLFDAVGAYASGIEVDTDALRRAVEGFDPSSLDLTSLDAEGLSRALGDAGLFEQQTTPSQQAALRRLETALALVEGWVDDVVDNAARDHLPSAAALRETLRRRRAAGGPAEQTFATLVGLELRPRRLREAAALWRALLDSRGAEGRDAVWAHPDLLPGPDDLDDPAGFAAGSGAPEVEDWERQLLGLDDRPSDGATGPAGGDRPAGTAPPATGTPPAGGGAADGPTGPEGDSAPDHPDQP